MDKKDTPILTETPKGLALIGDKVTYIGDFTNMIRRLSKKNLESELLVRAAKGRKSLFSGDSIPTVIDATAGMGEDSLLLAASGFRVLLIEYNPVIFRLLSDTVKRANEVPELSNAVKRMTVIQGDSIKILSDMPEELSQFHEPDIILLDPMFPERKKTGLIKKKFQLLKKIETPCENEEELFNVALLANPKKIIVKRPTKGDFLSGKKPSYSIDGSVIRYDCYVR